MSQTLTAKQKQFVQRYLISLNATKAYKEVYKTKNDNSAAASAAKLLRNPKILEAIEQGQQETKRRNNLSEDWVIQRLMAIGGFSLTQVATISEYGSVSLKSPDDCPDLAYCGVNVSQSSGEKGDSLTITSKNQVTALIKLGEHIGMWSDKGKDNEKRRHQEAVSARVLEIVRDIGESEAI